jgi:hypothetical protein
MHSYMKTRNLLFKISQTKVTRFLFAGTLLFGSSAAFAQVKIGTNPTTIEPNSNLEVEASTSGRKMKVDKTTGQVTIQDGTEGAGKIFTSDAVGGGSWQSVSLTAFAALQGGRENLPQSVNAGLLGTITFPGETTDPTNSFTPSTGTYVTPVAGHYVLFGSTQFDNSALPGVPNLDRTCLHLYVNNTSVTQGCAFPSAVFSSTSISNLVRLNAGDTVTLRAGAGVSSGSTFAVAVSTFYAYKISN